MKVLIFGNPFSRHTIRVAHELLKTEEIEEVDSITLYNIEDNYPGTKPPKLPYSHIYYLNLKKIHTLKLLRLFYYTFHLPKYRSLVKQITEKYDVISVQAVIPWSGILFSYLNKPIVSSFWGSEIWENLGKIKRFFQKLLLRNSVLITIISKTMAEKVKKEFPFVTDSKLRLVRYGFLEPEILDNVLTEVQENFKHRLGIKPYEKVVTISYSSAPRHRQDLILDSIKRIDEKFLEINNVKFIVPLTYGDPDWRNYIVKKISNHKFRERIKVIDKTLSDNEIAILRKITDVFINIPTQDSFSASMLEHLYVGSIVIVGSWLPYDDLFNSEAFIIKVKEPTEETIISAIKESITNLNSYKQLTQKNKNIAIKIGWKSNWAEILKEAVEIWKRRKK